MYTGHRRTLAKVSNGILTGFGRPRKDLGNKILQIDCSFEEFLYENVFEIMFRWCLTYDAVYIRKKHMKQAIDIQAPPDASWFY